MIIYTLKGNDIVQEKLAIYEGPRREGEIVPSDAQCLYIIELFKKTGRFISREDAEKELFQRRLKGKQ